MNYRNNAPVKFEDKKLLQHNLHPDFVQCLDLHGNQLNGKRPPLAHQLATEY